MTQEQKEQAAAEISRKLAASIRATVREIETCQAYTPEDARHLQSLVIRNLEAAVKPVEKTVRAKFALDVARRSHASLAENYARLVRSGEPLSTEEIHTWDGVIKSALRKVAAAETEANRVAPL